VPDLIIGNIYAAGAGAEAPPPYGDEFTGYYEDKSGNGNNLYVGSGLLLPGEGLSFGQNTACSLHWTVPNNFLTLESLFVPNGHESRGRMLDGSVFLGYDAWGRVYWGYTKLGVTHIYQQTRLSGIARRQINYVAVTHQWGSASSTKLYINGLPVPGAWVSGTGATTPSFGPIDSSSAMAYGDLLVQLSANGAAKSASDIANYAKGRA
jgi:hypothetical protein